MSKLFEVNGVVYNAERIDSVRVITKSRWEVRQGSVQHNVTNSSVDFVQLWRKALGEDVRTDEQRLREAEARAAAHSTNTLQFHSQVCNCMACRQCRALGL